MKTNDNILHDYNKSVSGATSTKPSQLQGGSGDLGTCPSCGYCPHCGRGGYRTYPYYYYPYGQPVYYYSGGTSGQASLNGGWQGQAQTATGTTVVG